MTLQAGHVQAREVARSDNRTSAKADVDREFTEFVNATSASLVRSAFLMTGDQQLAEDLVQDALARTYRSWRRLRRLEHPTAYARKTMYHLQVSRWRRRRVAETLTGLDLPVPEAGRDVALEVAVRAALLKLSPSQRAVIVLRYYEDRTEVETAEILNISKSTVHSQAQRALNRLAELVRHLKGEQG